jgi:putative two-component system response regulator
MKAQIEQIPHVEKKPKILVIDDEPAVSRVLLLVLKDRGFDVCIAATGGDAMRLTEEQNYDLILSDIDLPDMDGFEICRRLKQNPKLQAIPVILMSGRLAEGNEARALKIGAADYLSKPFRAKCLLSKVFAHIGKAKNEP